MTVTAEMVKTLRERTGLGMMACRKALLETEGGMDKAVELLRKKGELKAAKKAERGTGEGSIAVHISDDATAAAMVEVNCETDFVARNPEFRSIVEGLASRAAGWDFEGVVEDITGFDPDGLISSQMTQTISKLGENMLFRRAARITSNKGITGYYIHTNYKIGVLLELECPESARGDDAVRTLARDLCMQAASLNAICVAREEVPGEIVEKEREIYREQIKDKPADIQDKIIDGKLNAFYKENVLLEQPFIKEQKVAVSKHIESVGKSVGGPLAVRRFTRFVVGQD